MDSYARTIMTEIVASSGVRGCLSIKNGPVCFQIASERLRMVGRLLIYSNTSGDQEVCLDAACDKRVSSSDIDLDEVYEILCSSILSDDESDNGNFEIYVRFLGTNL